MRKVYLKVETRVIVNVDDDNLGVADIMDNLDVEVSPCSEICDVEDTEVTNFYIEDSK